MTLSIKDILTLYSVVNRLPTEQFGLRFPEGIQILLLFETSRPVIGPTRSSVQCLTGCVCVCVCVCVCDLRIITQIVAINKFWDLLSNFRGRCSHTV